MSEQSSENSIRKFFTELIKKFTWFWLLCVIITAVAAGATAALLRDVMTMSPEFWVLAAGTFFANCVLYYHDIPALLIEIKKFFKNALDTLKDSLKNLKKNYKKLLPKLFIGIVKNAIKFSLAFSASYLMTISMYAGLIALGVVAPYIVIPIIIIVFIANTAFVKKGIDKCINKLKTFKDTIKIKNDVLKKFINNHDNNESPAETLKKIAKNISESTLEFVSKFLSTNINFYKENPSKNIKKDLILNYIFSINPQDKTLKRITKINFYFLKLATLGFLTWFSQSGLVAKLAPNIGSVNFKPVTAFLARAGTRFKVFVTTALVTRLSLTLEKTNTFFNKIWINYKKIKTTKITSKWSALWASFKFVAWGINTVGNAYLAAGGVVDQISLGAASAGVVGTSMIGENKQAEMTTTTTSKEKQQPKETDKSKTSSDLLPSKPKTSHPTSFSSQSDYKGENPRATPTPRERTKISSNRYFFSNERTRSNLNSENKNGSGLSSNIKDNFGQQDTLSTSTSFSASSK
jgi:hypothetical protein